MPNTAKNRRNAAIYRAYLNGATQAALAKKYGVTPVRIRHILEREAFKIHRAEDAAA